MRENEVKIDQKVRDGRDENDDFNSQRTADLFAAERYEDGDHSLEREKADHEGGELAWIVDQEAAERTAHDAHSFDIDVVDICQPQGSHSENQHQAVAKKHTGEDETGSGGSETFARAQSDDAEYVSNDFDDEQSWAENLKG